MTSVGKQIGGAVLWDGAVSFRPGSCLRCRVIPRPGPRRTSETLLRKCSSPPGALPTTENQSADSSWLSGAFLPAGNSEIVPVISIVDSSVSVKASYVCGCTATVG